MKKKPLLAEQFKLGERLSLRKPEFNLLVVGNVEGINRQSQSGNLALTEIRIAGYGWISLADWIIEGENA
jgi:hypothetical protein